MAKFVREPRYLVLKIKDIRKYLDNYQLDILEDIVDTIQGGRIEEGKKSLIECVVVEDDWPEYETVWKMIEDRVTSDSTN